MDLSCVITVSPPNHPCARTSVLLAELLVLTDFGVCLLVELATTTSPTLPSSVHTVQRGL